MSYSWIASFFTAMRNTDWTALHIKSRPEARKFNWDGTSISDHLSEADWKSLDQEITEQLKLKNDRGVAITFASMLEDRLRWLIETQFIENLSEKRKASLFKGQGPLSTFSAKTEVAFALGLVKPEVRDQLIIIAQIRNKFAHGFKSVRFTDTNISELCKRLKTFDPPSSEAKADLREVYGLACLVCMVALFATGQLALASRGVAPFGEQSSK
ncbi:mannitol repressor [Rhodopseudomonas thermotolerans]|uniref:Mannitol repressor n=2 Tax=Rhodopseudomonas TaxID=1073 RepID=A0A336JQJ6_9BRAD|nr:MULTISPECIES: MltR family transcriptional regulator [Rhodopseudomonas]RED31830.1 mannitol repressor [Rhodopseudomonas pentothenatexigens]REF93131.1 mannitol repressor [Rhodopseudomonas thermotolerans]SSW91810.1 mannitol repressor [Rhodopseudomonas pentothenatexigens]